MNKLWTYVRLDELCEIRIGRTPRRDNPAYWGGTAVWVTISELNGDVISQSKEHISEIAVKEVMPEPVPAGTLLFSFKLSIGKMGIAGCPLYTNEAIAALIIKDSQRVNNSFLKYALYSVSHESAANTAVLGKVLNKEKVSAIQIPLPPLAEQERIVKLLDEAEALRKARLQASTRMADFVPALFEEMFGNPETNPKKWDIVPVNSFVKEFQAGKSILTDGNMSEDTKYWVLKVSAVTWGEYNPLESKPVPKDYEPLKSHFVREGDLLFSRANTTQLVGATVFVFETPKNRLLSDKLWRFVWKESAKVEPLYVWGLFQNKAIRRELGLRATGTGGSMKNISQPKVLSLNVPFPPIMLQKEFSERVKEVRAIQAVQTQSEERIEALYQSMLSRAFAGQL
ncbi:MAG: restriction endonuclease subunit S [Anaerolineales bacterium]|nr:restriction endonuclease subunit S [Anaerolineales bacterium]